MIFEASKEIYSSSSGSSGSKTQGSVCTTASSNTQPGPAHNKTYGIHVKQFSPNIVYCIELNMAVLMELLFIM